MRCSPTSFCRVTDEICGSDADCSDGTACRNGTCGKLVFVTSGSFTSAFGGVSGADALCTGIAQSSGLPGSAGANSYRAWLSDTTKSGTAAARLTPSPYPYLRLDGIKVADDWNDLVDGDIDARIYIDENGTSVSSAALAWSSTNPSGGLSSSSSSQGTVNACNDWAVTPGGVSNFGSVNATTSDWTALSGSALLCAGKMRRLYCFQQ